MNPYIYPSAPGKSPVTESIAGGKGANLVRIRQAGFLTPPFFILTSKLYEEYVSSFSEEFYKALEGLNTESPASIAMTAGAVRRLFTVDRLEGWMKDIIINSAEQLLSDGGFAAVRSSAVGEDGVSSSYAGQMDSFLYQKEPGEILESVVKCWASLYSDRAVAYRKASGFSSPAAGMAVIIQKMIDCRISGVTFTVNPRSRRCDEMLINCIYGLGEGIVTGGVEPDSLILGRKGELSVRETHTGEKDRMFVQDAEKGRGTVETNTDEALRKVLSIDKHRALEIGRQCAELENALQMGPLDIEWAIDREDVFHFLQARPITALSVLPSEDEYQTIWDNSNIVESYSGVTSPLTYSFAKKAYHRVYVQFCRVLKVPEKTVAENDFYLAHMIGFLRGRIYYNLKNWYRLISFLPGYSYNASFMEQMMGVAEKTEFSGKAESRPSALFDLIVSGASLLWNFLSIDGKSAVFQKLVDEKFEKYRSFDFNSADCHTLLDIYRELEASVLGNWKAPIINDFMAMISYGVLRLMIEKHLPEGEKGLLNRLLEGQGNIKSTMPVKMLREIAGFIKDDEALKDAFLTMDPGELAERCFSDSKDESWGKLNDKIKEYLDLYGFRSMNELKLEVPSLTEEPVFLFKILKNYIPEDSATAKVEGRQDEPAGEVVLKEVMNSMRGRFIKGIIPAGPVFRKILSMAKKAVAFREFQRFARTNMFGLVRRIFLAIGENFVKFGVLSDRDDIFYLTVDEIFGFITGSAVSVKLSDICRIRKLEFEEYRNEDELPDRIVTTGPVYVNDLSQRPAAGASDGELRGISCCPGVVRGTVKVVLSPSDDLNINGAILVAARTDPGWVPLYPSASGLLIERGSILSHSAIVAREMGLPAIVGIRGITSAVKTGHIVEMDGGAGTVRIISSHQTP